MPRLGSASVVSARRAGRWRCASSNQTPKRAPAGPHGHLYGHLSWDWKADHALTGYRKARAGPKIKDDLSAGFVPTSCCAQNGSRGKDARCCKHEQSHRHRAPTATPSLRSQFARAEACWRCSKVEPSRGYGRSRGGRQPCRAAAVTAACACHIRATASAEKRSDTLRQPTRCLDGGRLSVSFIG